MKEVKQTAGDASSQSAIHAYSKPPTDNKKKVRLGLVVVVVLGMVFGLWLWLKPPSVAQENNNFNTMMSQVKNYRLANQNAAAQKVLLGFWNTHPRVREHRYFVAVNLLQIYAGQGNTKAAEQWSQTAVDTASSDDEYMSSYYSLALYCSIGGDKQCALTNYQKALPYIKKKTDTYDQLLAVRVQSNIQTLQGQLKQ